ncbi:MULTISPECIES: hypothetical protein [unclassified Pseudoxanthomonas]|uniref:hypothetical protein n=1 Tax=unclassified Pseudoxanthomonas TaxID=2645906 RepID=UPI00307765BC
MSLQSRSLFAFGIATLLAPALPAVAAAEGAAPGDDVRFTGSLMAVSPSLPRGVLNIEPYFIYHRANGMFDGRGDRVDSAGRDSWAIAVPVNYGLTEQLELNLGLNASDGGRGWQVGDTVARIKYQIAGHDGGHSTPAITLAASHTFSTGRHDRLELAGNDRLHDASGSGVSSNSLAVYTQKYSVLPNGRTLRTRVNVRYDLPSQGNDIDGVSIYGTEAGFRGRIDTRSGYAGLLALEYSISSRWAAALDLQYKHQRGYRLYGTAADLTQVDERNGSSWQFGVAPAVEYHFSDRVGMILGVYRPLSGRNSSATISPQLAINMVF